MPEGALVTIWEIAIFQSAFLKKIKQSPHLFLMNFVECLIQYIIGGWKNSAARSLRRNSGMQIYQKFQNIIRVQHFPAFNELRTFLRTFVLVVVGIEKYESALVHLVIVVRNTPPTRKMLNSNDVLKFLINLHSRIEPQRASGEIFRRIFYTHTQIFTGYIFGPNIQPVHLDGKRVFSKCDIFLHKLAAVARFLIELCRLFLKLRIILKGTVF